MNESICFRMFFNVRAEALSNNSTRKVAQGGTFPALSHRRSYNSRITPLTVSYATSPMLEGESSFATKYKTQPQNCQALASALRMMSASPSCLSLNPKPKTLGVGEGKGRRAARRRGGPVSSTIPWGSQLFVVLHTHPKPYSYKLRPYITCIVESKVRFL